MATYSVPDNATKRTVSGPSARASGSVSYDYTGADLIAKLLSDEGDVESARQAALYKGDNATSLQAGQKIRALRALRAGITPVRVRSTESSVGREGGAESYEAPARQNSLAPPAEKNKDEKKG